MNFVRNPGLCAHRESPVLDAAANSLSVRGLSMLDDETGSEKRGLATNASSPKAMTTQ